MGGALVTEIHIYPVKGEDGQELSVADIGFEGLAGDRRWRDNRLREGPGAACEETPVQGQSEIEKTGPRWGGVLHVTQRDRARILLQTFDNEHLPAPDAAPREYDLDVRHWLHG